MDALNIWLITTQNHHPHTPKMEMFPKPLLQIILVAIWLVRHSSMSPSQQWRPLPYLLYLSFFYMYVKIPIETSAKCRHCCWRGDFAVNVWSNTSWPTRHAVQSVWNNEKKVIIQLFLRVHNHMLSNICCSRILNILAFWNNVVIQNGQIFSLIIDTTNMLF